MVEGKKKQSSNKIYYLEQKIAEGMKKVTTISEQGKSSKDDISQSLMNIISKHYSLFENKQIGKKLQMCYIHHLSLMELLKIRSSTMQQKILKHVAPHFLKGINIIAGSLNVSAIDLIREHVEGTKRIVLALFPPCPASSVLQQNLQLMQKSLFPSLVLKL